MDLDKISTAQFLRDSPFFFIHKVWGFRTDGIHEKILDYMIDERRGVILCPRGHGKSKLNQAYISWYILHNPNERVILISDSDGKAQNFLRTIKAVLESSPIIQEFYGDVIGDRWTDHAITLKGRTEIHTEPSLMCVGAGSGAATGLHCTLLVIDDIESFDSARSEVKRSRLQDWYKTTLLPVLMSGGKIIVAGTRYHNLDIYNMMINDLHYKPLRIPAINEDGLAACEWLVPLKDRENEDGSIDEGLETIKENLGSVIWQLQYMNDASILSDDAIIKPDYIQYYQNIQWKDNKLYVNNMGSLVLIKKIIMGVDPAISEKEKADFTAIVVVGKGDDGNLYVLDFVNKHLTFNKQINEIKGLALKWQVNKTNIEQVGYQEALIQELKRESGLRINPIKPTRDKVARLNLVSGFFESHKVHFLKKMTPITNQLLTFTGNGKDHDDLVDACVYSIWGFRSSGSGMLVLHM